MIYLLLYTLGVLLCALIARRESDWPNWQWLIAICLWPIAAAAALLTLAWIWKLPRKPV